MKKYFSERMLLDTFLQFMAGFLTGIVLALVAGIAGYFLFETGSKILIVLLKILPIVSGLVAVVSTAFKHFKVYQRNQNLPDPTTTWLDENFIEITFDVARSSDSIHQLRMTKTDGPEHYHAEILDPKSFVILESNVCGEIKSKPLNKGESRWLTIFDSSKMNFVVTHYLGCPPELSGQADNRILLPKPQILVIEEMGTDVFLFRFTEAGEYAGDTWHQSVEGAKKQAAFEYRIVDDAWEMIPDEVDDVVCFVSNM